MPTLAHQQLVAEATRYGTGEILRQMPASYTPELEQAVRQAVLYYAGGMDTWDQRHAHLGCQAQA